MGVIHLGPLSALPGTCIVLCALAMLYDPGGTCTVLAYRPAHYCLRPKLEYRLPLVVLTRLNRFTLSHYGSRTPLSTLHAGLTASHARLSTGCLLGFAGSGLSPDYTIHAELAHNFRTLTPHRGLSIRRLYGFRLQRRHKKWRRRRLWRGRDRDRRGAFQYSRRLTRLMDKPLWGLKVLKLCASSACIV